MALRLGLLAFLIYWSFVIVRPFLAMLMWGAILTVALYPTYAWLVDRLGGRRGLAATLITIVSLLVLIGPATWLGKNLIEALPKIAELSDLPLTWHFIGRLQANKTRDVAASFDWVHSVDRKRIAERLDEHRPRTRAPLRVLLQVRVDETATHGGVEAAELPALADAVRALPRLELRGLMCMPEPSGDEASQRVPFRRLRELLVDLNGRGHALDTLSMGMSDDLEAAIAEGATLVRVGTAIFGPRS